MSWRYIFFAFLLLVGCSTPAVKEGKVIPHNEYKHYYVVKDQGTDQNVQEKVETVTDKIKKVFKKDPVNSSKSEKPPTEVKSVKSKTSKPVVIPKRRTRQTQPVTELPIVVEEEKLMPMTKEQVEIVELKNNFAVYLTLLQALVILGLSIFIIFLYKKKKEKKINNGKVLNL